MMRLPGTRRHGAIVIMVLILLTIAPLRQEQKLLPSITLGTQFSTIAISTTESAQDVSIPPTKPSQRERIVQFFQDFPLNDTDVSWIKDYIYWHYEMRQSFPDGELFKNPNAPRLAIMYMDPAIHQGGLTDRMKGIGHFLRLCNETERVLLMKWYNAPLGLEAFLLPNLFNWTMPNHPNGSTGMKLRESYDGPINDNEEPKVRLFRFTNQLGNYLHPFGTIWHSFFVPSPAVQSQVEETMTRLSISPKSFDAIHCRLGHPAYRDRKEYNARFDKDKGYNFKGVNRVRALNTATHAIACSQWLAREHSPPGIHGNETLPIYFYSDTPELTKTVTEPDSLNATTREQVLARRQLVNITSRLRVVGRPNVTVAHLENRKNDTSTQSYTSTFVDLYVAMQARCISIGVGRFAYMAAKISGSSCWTRHEAPSKNVGDVWGMAIMSREVPMCPIPPMLT